MIHQQLLREKKHLSQLFPHALYSQTTDLSSNSSMWSDVGTAPSTVVLPRPASNIPRLALCSWQSRCDQASCWQRAVRSPAGTAVCIGCAFLGQRRAVSHAAARPGFTFPSFKASFKVSWGGITADWKAPEKPQVAHLRLVCSSVGPVMVLHIEVAGGNWKLDLPHRCCVSFCCCCCCWMCVKTIPATNSLPRNFNLSW